MLLPQGVRALPGPAALVAVAYTDSPIGAYVELSLGVPARIGLRPGLCVVFQVVSVPVARFAYRSNWGLPANLGVMTWSDDGPERVVRCEEPGIELRGTPVGPALPAIVPVRSVQRRSDGPVVLPRRFVALARWARTTVAVAENASLPRLGPAGLAPSGPGSLPAFDLTTIAGDHAGVVLAGARVVARPARHPAGLWSSLRAPLIAPEPA
jgi:hypothetical protein